MFPCVRLRMSLSWRGSIRSALLDNVVVDDAGHRDHLSRVGTNQHCRLRGVDLAPVEKEAVDERRSLAGQHHRRVLLNSRAFLRSFTVVYVSPVLIHFLCEMK